MITKPRLEIDPVAVEEMAGNGLTIEEIAFNLHIDPSTLHRRKRDVQELQDAIKRGKAKNKNETGNILMGLVRQGNIAALIWHEKTRHGYSEKVSMEHTMKPVHELTDDELARIAEEH